MAVVNALLCQEGEMLFSSRDQFSAAEFHILGNIWDSLNYPLSSEVD